ncbi:MAG: hypothetical protein IPO81_09730 [Kouleothrix sp.]|nr:hypothetical protein [Kouleothrix sp.]
MNTSYHECVTESVTFNPFLPAIGRVYDVLLRAGPTNTTIQTTNRELAVLAQLKSPSQIPGILRKLEAQGLIERITEARGSLIVVTDRSDMADRSFCPSDSDQGVTDRSTNAQSANPNEMPDRSIGVESERSDMIDPPPTPLYGRDLESYQEEESARAIGDAIAENPLYRRLMQQTRMDRRLAERIVRTSLGGLTEFEQDLALASRLDAIRAPFWFAVYRWSNGQRVLAQEPSHERPSSPSADRPKSDGHTGHAGHQRRRRAERPGTRGGDAVGSNADPAYQAYLAEIVRDIRPVAADFFDCD